MKQKLLNIVKGIALLCIPVIINALPFLMINYQKKIPQVIYWGLVVGYLLLVVGVMVFLWTYYHRLRPERFRFTWTDFGYAFVWFLLGRALAIIGNMLIQTINGSEMTVNDTAIFGMVEHLKGGFLPFSLLFVLTIGCVAPVIEELVFRGLFVELVFRKSQKWLAATVTSLIFALFHAVIPLEFLLYFGIGMIFFLAYQRRGSIVDAIAVHFLNNLLGALAILVMIFI